MRILFTRFPLESSFGGAEVQTLSLIEGFIKRGHTVAFLGSCPVLLRECRARHIPCVELDIGAPPVTKWAALSFVWRGRRMREQLKRALRGFERFDAVFMLSLSEKILATREIAKTGTKVIWMEHDRVGRWLTANPWLTDLRQASVDATTVCVSALSRKIYLDLGWDADRTVAIPNGIDLRRFESLKLKAQSSKLQIGCVARLTYDKGVDLLIDAVKDLPDVSLHIIGSGRDEQSIQEKIASIEPASRTGRQPATNQRITIEPAVDDLPAFYRSIDVLVLPSREHDPFGLVAAEAMACGTPVIVTDACGIAGYLEDGKSASIVRAGDVEALRSAIINMMNPHVRQTIGQSGQELSIQRFSVDQMIGRYETLFTGP